MEVDLVQVQTEYMRPTDPAFPGDGPATSTDGVHETYLLTLHSLEMDLLQVQTEYMRPTDPAFPGDGPGTSTDGVHETY